LKLQSINQSIKFNSGCLAHKEKTHTHTYKYKKNTLSISYDYAMKLNYIPTKTITADTNQTANSKKNSPYNQSINPLQSIQSNPRLFQIQVLWLRHVTSVKTKNIIKYTDTKTSLQTSEITPVICYSF